MLLVVRYDHFMFHAALSLKISYSFCHVFMWQAELCLCVGVVDWSVDAGSAYVSVIISVLA